MAAIEYRSDDSFSRSHADAVRHEGARKGRSEDRKFCDVLAGGPLDASAPAKTRKHKKERTPRRRRREGHKGGRGDERTFLP